MSNLTFAVSAFNLPTYQIIHYPFLHLLIYQITHLPISSLPVYQFPSLSFPPDAILGVFYENAGVGELLAESVGFGKIAGFLGCGAFIYQALYFFVRQHRGRWIGK